MLRQFRQRCPAIPQWLRGGTAKPLVRLLWAVVLAFHAAAIPPLLVGLGGPGAVELSAWARMAALLGSAAFFVLKIIDVPWLRLKPGWRSMATAVLIIGLLHLGVIERETSLSAAHPGVVLCVAAVWTGEPIIRGLGRLLGRVRHALSAQHCRRFAEQRLGYAWRQVFSPLRLFFVPCQTAPRAPPSV